MPFPPPALDRLIRSALGRQDHPVPQAGHLHPGATKSSLENCLMQVRKPDLRQYLNSQTPSNGNPRIQAVKRFKETTEFPVFRQTMQQTLRVLRDFAMQGQTNMDASQAWSTLETNLELTFGPPPVQNDYVPELFDMYQQTCPLLQELATMAQWCQLPDAPVSLGQRDAVKQMIKDLSSEITVCGPGVMDNVAAMHRKVRQLLLPVPFAEYFKQARLDVARQIMANHAKHVFGGDPYFNGNQIHIVNAWQKALANRLDLPAPEDDRYASTNYVRDVPPSEWEVLFSSLKRGLEPSAIAEKMALDILQELRQFCDTSSPDWHNARNAVLDTLSSQYGQIDPFKVCTVDNELQIPTGLHTNPTLLAVDLLGKVQTIQATTPPPLATKVPLQPNCLMAQIQDLVWVEDHSDADAPERRLLQFKELDKPGLAAWINAKGNGHLAKLTQVLHECFRNIDLPITAVFRQIKFSEMDHGFWTDAIRMAALNWPADQPMPLPCNPLALQFNYTNTPEQDFIESLMNPQLDDWFDVPQFKHAMETVLQANTDLANIFLNIAGHADWHGTKNKCLKSFIAAVELLHNTPHYEPLVVLEKALNAKRPEAMEAVLKHWPENEALPHATYFLGQVLPLKPSEALVTKLIEVGANYPHFDAPDPTSSEPISPSKDLLSTAVLNHWTEVLDAMLEKNCLPPALQSHQQWFMLEILQPRGTPEQREKTVLKLMDIQDRLNEPIDSKSDRNHSVMAKGQKLYVAAARLLQRSGHLNTHDDDGYTQLQMAVREGNTALVKALVEAGALIDMHSESKHIGKTALHMAYRAKDMTMVELLKRLGADTEIKDKRGRLPRDLLR